MIKYKILNLIETVMEEMEDGGSLEVGAQGGEGKGGAGK